MRHKQNADTEETETTSKGSDTVEVSLRWIHQQIGRVLEIFVILQFVTGAFIFFGGIFLLLWAVIPATSLKAGSYMLLAFYVIGRALLGLVGYYTDNFCLLFSYGVLLVATFVVRTILTLVRLKITSGVDKELLIPPLLQACPGALSAPIELVCSLLECSQAFCSFYLCWIIAKTASIEKNFEESRLNIATEIAKYLSQQETRRKDETISMTKKSSESKDGEELISDNKQETIGEDRQSTTESDGKSRHGHGPAKAKTPQLPLKGILHQPSQSHQPSHSEHKPHDYDQVDYFSQYRKYPHTMTHPRPTHLAYQSSKGYQGNEKDVVSNEMSEEENLDQLVEDFNNNNNAPISTEMTPHHGYYPQTNAHWEPFCGNVQFNEAHNYPQTDSPDYLDPSMMRNELPMGRVIQMNRALSPTPPSELNLSSPSSPLLYEQRVAMYHGYGSTNGPSHYHQQMYR